MSEYCVYLTIYKGNKLPPFYIGSSTITRIKEGYRGSVSSKLYKKIWQQELKQNYGLFKTVIIKTYSTRQEAVEKEAMIQRKLNVIHNCLYANRAIYNKGYLIYGHTHTAETRKKMSIARSSRPAGYYTHSNEVKNKISLNSKGNQHRRGIPHTEESKQKISRKGSSSYWYGKTRTEEVKQKISCKLKGNKDTDSTKLKKSLSKMGSKNPSYGKSPTLETILKRCDKWVITHPDGTTKVVPSLKLWCKTEFVNPTSAATNLLSRGTYKGYKACKYD